MIKKLLGIVVLGLVWCNTLVADHYGIFSNCYIQKITDPRLVVYEKKSFLEMKNLPDVREYLDYEKFYITSIILDQSNIKEYKALELDSSYRTIKVVTENDSGSLKMRDATYKSAIRTGDYLKLESTSIYSPIIIDFNKKIIEIKNHIMVDKGFGYKYLPNSHFSIFLKCKYESSKHSIRKSKIVNYHNYILILLGIISLINFGGIVYLIKRKK